MNAREERERIRRWIAAEVGKTGMVGVVVGVSGGVDSAVVSALCALALGPEHVEGYILPSAITREEDVEDAMGHCRQFGIPCRVIGIEPILQAYRTLEGYVEEKHLLGNLMARTRMAILYYHANRTGRLVCGTSNRSEYMLGYCTKFGDGAADLQPILHLYKSEVYLLAEEMGISPRIRTKVPSAGLWPGQSDEAEIGLSYAEIERALRALEASGWRATSPLEERVLSLVEASRHKREPAESLLRAP